MGIKKKKFIIMDWAGNICFHGKEFNYFDDAWGFLYEHPLYKDLPENDFNEAMGEYYVEEKV